MDILRPPCREWRPALREAVDGGLMPDARRHLEQHINGCAPCAGAAQGLARLDALLRAAPLPNPPVALRAAILGRVESLRRRERCYRHASLGLIGTAAALMIALQPASFMALGANLGGAAQDLIELLSIANALHTFDDALSGAELSFPLALLALVPLFIALNLLALRRPTLELRHGS